MLDKYNNDQKEEDEEVIENEPITKIEKVEQLKKEEVEGVSSNLRDFQADKSNDLATNEII